MELPDLFLCTRLSCRLTRFACVSRQNVRHAGSRNAVEKVSHKPISLAMCDPAKCEQGAANRQALGDLGGERVVRQDGTGNYYQREKAIAAQTKKQTKKTETEDTTMAKTSENPRICTTCNKKLRSSSVGETCFRCRVAAGEARPGHVLQDREKKLKVEKTIEKKAKEEPEQEVTVVEIPAPAPTIPSLSSSPITTKDLTRVRDYRSVYRPLEIYQLVAHRKAIEEELARREAAHLGELAMIRAALGKSQPQAQAQDKSQSAEKGEAA